MSIVSTVRGNAMFCFTTSVLACQQILWSFIYVWKSNLIQCAPVIGAYVLIVHKKCSTAIVKNLNMFKKISLLLAVYTHKKVSI